MKLWQKISLIALAFVMLAIQLTQYVLLERSFENAVEREQQTASAAHEALSASLSNHAAYQRLKAGKLLLSTEEINELLQNTVTPGISTASSIYVLRGEEIITAAGTDIFSGASDFDLSRLTPDADAHTGFSVITEIDARPQLVIASNLKLETADYVLFTAYDISEIYNTRENELSSARRTGILCSAAISAVLFLFVWLSLHPLKTAVRTIREAANGNYSLRVPEKGSEELRTLARSINHMSASIDEREQKLREIAESRRRFADSMAHEMKTPLTSILGFADILRIQRTVPDAQRRDFADMIVQEAKHLRGLSAKLLDLASTDSAQLDLTDIPVEQLFADIAASMSPILARRGIRLETAHKSAVLHIDRELFLSLFYNLIDNAAKASADHAVIRLAQFEDDGCTVLSVRDEGVGMQPETIRRATEAFYMEDKARSRKSGGAGLGLALCDSICHRHGARLEIRSVYGQGTTVLIHMNAMPMEQNEEKEALK